MLDIPGFTIFRNHRKIDKRGGGVACYIKSSLSKFCSTKENLDISNKRIEMLNIIHQSPNHIKQPITIVYHPPTGDIKDFLKSIKEIVSMTEFSKMEKIIMGDFNIETMWERIETVITQYLDETCPLHDIKLKFDLKSMQQDT